MGGKDKELQRDRILDMTIFLMIFFFTNSFGIINTASFRY